VRKQQIVQRTKRLETDPCRPVKDMAQVLAPDQDLRRDLDLTLDHKHNQAQIMDQAPILAQVLVQKKALDLQDQGLMKKAVQKRTPVLVITWKALKRPRQPLVPLRNVLKDTRHPRNTSAG
jgi:hypothetical protein